jgi:hypothetical protein
LLSLFVSYIFRGGEDAQSMAAKYKPDQSIVKIGGVPHEATIRAVLESTDGLKLVVDFGH